MLAILIPVIWGLWLLWKKEFKKRNTLLEVTGAGLIVSVILACTVIFGGELELRLFSIGKNMDIFFRVDI